MPKMYFACIRLQMEGGKQGRKEGKQERSEGVKNE
jgi:hypothetical protein